MNTEEIFEYAKEKYGSSPEYLWTKWPEYAVLRHPDNKKWYAVIMNVTKKQLGLDAGNEEINIIDVKCDSMEIDFFRTQKGFLAGYHMNKQNWLTILLDGTVEKKRILEFIDESFILTK